MEPGGGANSQVPGRELLQRQEQKGGEKGGCEEQEAQERERERMGVGGVGTEGESQGPEARETMIQREAQTLSASGLMNGPWH